MPPLQKTHFWLFALHMTSSRTQAGSKGQTKGCQSAKGCLIFKKEYLLSAAKDLRRRRGNRPKGVPQLLETTSICLSGNADVQGKSEKGKGKGKDWGF